MANPFRSFGSATKPARREFTEADVLNAATQLLEEHGAAREAATKTANSVCGNCKGSGAVDSTLAPGESVKCWACEGTGQPNDKMVSLPELTAADNERLYRLNRLFVNYPQYRGALLGLVRQYFPEMYADATGEKAAN